MSDVILPRVVRSGLVHAVALARRVLLEACGGFEDGPLARAQMAAEVAQFRMENALLREEIRIKDSRLARIRPAERPHYEPVERMAILNLRAAAGWNAAETARRFLLAPLTIANWMRRLDEQGADALVRTLEPVNRFPDFVAALVRILRATLPAMGKVRLAQVLARAGLHLAPTTIRRLAKTRSTPTTDPGGRAEPRRNRERVIRARYPHHLWHVDLTIVPTLGGFWLPWIPHAVPPVWPFAWWVVVVLDHFSRAVVGHAVFRKQPTSEEVCRVLDAALKTAGNRPRHLVSDRGVQFGDAYRAWCEPRGIRPRFGAVGKKGSIAVVERFIGSMKAEHFRRIIIVSLRQETVVRELGSYVRWYNEVRPHTSLRGETPLERLRGRNSARDEPGFEPRPRHPLRGRTRVRDLALVVEHLDGQKHLPVVSLREAA